MVDRWRGVVWVDVGIATRLRGRFGGGYLCEMDLVAVSKGYQRKPASWIKGNGF